MSMFDLWDGRDKLSMTLADGTPYGPVMDAIKAERQQESWDEYWRLVALDR